MRFGPYTMAILKAATDQLSNKQIPFEVEDDKELLAHLEQEWKSLPHTEKRGPTYDPAFLFLHVEEAHVRAHQAELAHYGLSLEQHEEPDFSKEEYVCPQCDKVVAQESGFCATHRVPLLPWSEHIAKQRAAGGNGMSWAGVMTWTVLLLGGVLLAAHYFGLGSEH